MSIMNLCIMKKPPCTTRRQKNALVAHRPPLAKGWGNRRQRRGGGISSIWGGGGGTPERWSILPAHGPARAPAHSPGPDFPPGRRGGGMKRALPLASRPAALPPAGIGSPLRPGEGGRGGRLPYHHLPGDPPGGDLGGALTVCA